MDKVQHSADEFPEVVNYIVLSRIYDALIVLLRNINPEEAEALVEAHEKGLLLAPPPAIVAED